MLRQGIKGNDTYSIFFSRSMSIPDNFLLSCCDNSQEEVAAETGAEEGVAKGPIVSGNPTPMVQIPKELLDRIWQHRMETMPLRMSIFRNLYDQGVVVGSGSGYGADYVIYESK